MNRHVSEAAHAQSPPHAAILSEQLEVMHWMQAAGAAPSVPPVGSATEPSHF
jgi:hypothetical protein